ncbi:RluA family pseudouridine synthase [Crocosphaera watsonii WH 8501]|uniref:Pseudouridine synthase n=1 Tax=Crocosphaera watsonii WH 8501 TaxID=165597 RepID=Q4BZI0_CROWT|nr:RluA family pseudouridine synthase [Crocosphaera watsonii]EAM49318.1 Pseudouridine synthase, RluD [Crocosphaera watsonii WH 8501]
MNKGWIYREKIKQNHAGLTLIEYYTKHYHHSNYQQWLERIISGQVLVDEQTVDPQTVLKTGQRLSYHRPPWQEPEVPLSFEIIYEDDNLLIVNKPSGLPVLPGGGFLEHTLLWQLKKQYPQNEPIPIHRLGRGTSGLMLMGKSAIARSHLTQQMREQKISKVYQGLIGKNNLPDKFSIDHPIGKIPDPVLGYIYGAKVDGKYAYSECRVLGRYVDKTLLEVTILTGRPHQIRIHLATIGYPLLGDPLYVVGGIPKTGFKEDNDTINVPGDCGYFLHAYQLSFVHPVTNQCLTFTCERPFLEE